MLPPAQGRYSSLRAATERAASLEATGGADIKSGWWRRRGSLHRL